MRGRNDLGALTVRELKMWQTRFCSVRADLQTKMALASEFEAAAIHSAVLESIAIDLRLQLAIENRSRSVAR